MYCQNLRNGRWSENLFRDFPSPDLGDRVRQAPGTFGLPPHSLVIFRPVNVGLSPLWRPDFLPPFGVSKKQTIEH